ncbi:MAG: hypothetical protein ACI855_004002 [Myxococcota bacterium]|jgi:hypothetical protein
MVVRASAVGVVVASLLACGGLGGPAPTERAIAFAENRVRTGTKTTFPWQSGSEIP